VKVMVVELLKLKTKEKEEFYSGSTKSCLRTSDETNLGTYLKVISQITYIILQVR